MTAFFRHLALILLSLLATFCFAYVLISIHIATTDTNTATKDDVIQMASDMQILRDSITQLKFQVGELIEDEKETTTRLKNKLALEQDSMGY